MTAIELYRETLQEIVDKYHILNVLEIGIDKGISTKVFCDKGCFVTGIDIKLPDFKNERLKIYLGDASVVLPSIKDKFDLVYLDALYNFDRLAHDVPYVWDLLNEGGVLIFNEYIDFVNNRHGEVREFVHEWAFHQGLKFEVYPLRNGFALFQK